MKAALGSTGVLWGLLASLAGIAVLARGVRRRDPRLVATGRRVVPLVLFGALVAAGAMEWALVTRDFSLVYVADNGSRATPLLYTISGMWGALEGSILLWALVLACYLALMARRFRGREHEPESAWALLTGLVIAAFFFALMLGPSNPFRTVTGIVPADGRGPLPLLQNHPLMAFHPPILYIGLVGFTVPFAYAVASLATGRVGEGWLVATRRMTLTAFGFLTVGIVLGGWWSYEVLGWGGYWAWDPVENAVFIPWLTAAAYLHSVIIQERRGMLCVWNLALIGATFWLTILATFLTRSGVLNSVHAFGNGPVGPLLLGFFAVGAVAYVGLIGWRGERLRAPARIDSPVSREAAFLANNLLFAAFAFVVLLGTVFPLIAEALRGEQLSVGEPYFNRMTGPIGIALLFLMAVAPALPWRATSTAVARRRLAVPAWVAAATMAVLALAGARGVAQVVTFGLATFALAGVARQVVVGVRVRRAVAGGSWPAALTATVAGNRRLYGGLVVHVGVVMIAVALAASNGYDTSRELRLDEGESAAVAGYRLTYLGATETDSAIRSTLKARVRIEQGGRDLGVYEPALSQYPNFTQAIGTPSVRTGLLRDVYLTLTAAPERPGGPAVIGARVNPMIVWLWVGAAVMGLGTAIAAWPARRPRAGRTAQPVSEKTPAPEPEPVGQ